MAIYHCTVQTIGRSSGRSSVGAAAYRAGEKLYNNHDGITHDYSNRKGVIHSEIMLPSNAPEIFADRSTLWNAIEEVSTRKDARTAREIEIAIPIEFDRPEGLQVIRDYVTSNFVEKGMCADVAIHDSDGNPHAHILLTTRNVGADGFGQTNRTWNAKAELENWRKNWANVCNEHLKNKGFQTRIDHRTLEAQGIDRAPTVHVGAVAHKMEQRGILTERGQLNRDIKQAEAERMKIDQEIKKLENQKKSQSKHPTKAKLGGIEVMRERIEERKRAEQARKQTNNEKLTAREMLEKSREIENEYER